MNQQAPARPMPDEPPPFLRSWRRVYIGVLLYLAVVVALLWLFTRAFAP